MARISVAIKRSRLGLFSQVELYEGGKRVALTTMRPGVKRSSPEIREFIRRHRHEPKQKEES